jgi:hypothetical protein
MKITLEQFKSRFVPLVMGGGSLLKKKVEDQHILFVSAVQVLEPGRRYSEAELNEALKPWSATFGDGFGLDHVTLRRHLIDEGYLLRDAAGTEYSLNVEDPPTTFDPGIADLDHESMLEDALQEREERRRKFTQSND